jgi:hypothetical protein
MITECHGLKAPEGWIWKRCKDEYALLIRTKETGDWDFGNVEAQNSFASAMVITKKSSPWQVEFDDYIDKFGEHYPKEFLGKWEVSIWEGMPYPEPIGYTFLSSRRDAMVELVCSVKSEELSKGMSPTTSHRMYEECVSKMGKPTPYNPDWEENYDLGGW